MFCFLYASAVAWPMASIFFVSPSPRSRTDSASPWAIDPKRKKAASSALKLTSGFHLHQNGPILPSKRRARCADSYSITNIIEIWLISSYGTPAPSLSTTLNWTKEVKTQPLNAILRCRTVGAVSHGNRPEPMAGCSHNRQCHYRQCCRGNRHGAEAKALPWEAGLTVTASKTKKGEPLGSPFCILSFQLS